MNVDLIVIKEAETVDRFSCLFAARVEHVGYLDDDLDGKAALFVLVEDESLAVIREPDLQPAFHEQEGDLDISDVGVSVHDTLCEHFLGREADLVHTSVGITDALCQASCERNDRCDTVGRILYGHLAHKDTAAQILIDENSSQPDSHLGLQSAHIQLIVGVQREVLEQNKMRRDLERRNRRILSLRGHCPPSRALSRSQREKYFHRP